MSIGPVPKEEGGITRLGKITRALHSSVEAYFVDPVHYIFFSFLTATMVGLFLGMSFTWEYYLILVLVGIANLYKTYGNRSENSTGDREKA